jgi:hypothetical protein
MRFGEFEIRIRGHTRYRHEERTTGYIANYGYKDGSGDFYIPGSATAAGSASRPARSAFSK